MSEIIQFPKNPKDFKKKELTPGFVECPKCGEEISMKSVKCRHCGINFSGGVLRYTKPTDVKYKSVGKIALYIGILVLLLLGLFKILGH